MVFWGATDQLEAVAGSGDGPVAATGADP